MISRFVAERRKPSGVALDRRACALPLQSFLEVVSARILTSFHAGRARVFVAARRKPSGLAATHRATGAAPLPLGSGRSPV